MVSTQLRINGLVFAQVGLRLNDKFRNEFDIVVQDSRLGVFALPDGRGALQFRNIHGCRAGTRPPSSERGGLGPGQTHSHYWKPGLVCDQLPVQLLACPADQWLFPRVRASLSLGHTKLRRWR